MYQLSAFQPERMFSAYLTRNERRPVSLNFAALGAPASVAWSRSGDHVALSGAALADGVASVTLDAANVGEGFVRADATMADGSVCAALVHVQVRGGVAWRT